MTFEAGVQIVTAVEDFSAAAQQPGTLFPRYLLHGVVGFFLTIIGGLGNMLSVLVLRSQTPSNVNFLLMCLAVADTVFLINGILHYSLGTINRYNGMFVEYRRAMPLVIPYISGMAFLSHSLTVWIVVVITVERYIAVCHPLKAVEICTRRRTQCVVFILVVTLTTFSLPRFVEKTAGYVLDAELNGDRPVLTVIYREFHQHPVYIYLYDIALYGGFQFLFPLLLLVTLNARLLYALNTARKLRHRLQQVSSDKQSQKDDNISLMIVVVICVFLICQFPNFLSYALRLLEIVDSSRALVVNPQGSSPLNPITETLLKINSSVNFLIYMLVGKEFRRSLFRLFRISKRQ